MKSLSSIGLGLSVVFGCLLLALVAELYYLLWWKRRFIGRDIENDYSNPTRDFLYMFCCKNPSSCSSSMNISNNMTHQEMRTNSTSLVEGIQNKDLWVKPSSMNGSYSNEYDYFGQNPRFLFTIVEETKEDLDSEDGKSAKSRKGSRNLSDLFLNIETPYMTPLGSPSFFVTPPHRPPITPLMRPPTSSSPPSSSSTCSYNPSHGFNPLFESSTDAEFNRIKSSPPPKFKFLQDAEEKLYRRKKLMEEVSEKKNGNGYSQENSGVPANFGKEDEEEEEGSFITIVVDRNNKEKASSSQVIPLASSPSTFSDHHQQQQPRMISKFR